MTYQEVLENARKRMAPRCRVCPECNGIACKGVMPGPAGKGASRTFQRNVAWLGEHVKLEMDVTGGNQERNMEISLFGKTFAAPIFVAPIGLIPYTYTEDMTDRLYCDAVMLGAKRQGFWRLAAAALRRKIFMSRWRQFGRMAAGGFLL